MDIRACKNCKYAAKRNAEQYQCRVYPPQAATRANNWPIVSSEAWCGVFQLRDIRADRQKVAE